MSDETELLLTRETFLAQLGVQRAGAPLPGAAAGQLYAMTCEYLKQRGAATAVDAAAGRSAELPYKVPGLPIHVRLSAPSRDELKDFVTCGLLLLGIAAKADPATITVGLVVSLMSRVTLLNAKYGERCVVEAVLEAARPTQRNVCAVLHGKTCRRPDAGCRFHRAATNTCLLGLKEIAPVLKSLEDQKVVRVVSTVQPAEYAITT